MFDAEKLVISAICSARLAFEVEHHDLAIYGLQLLD